MLDYRFSTLCSETTHLPYFTRCESHTRPWSLHCCIRKWDDNKYAHRWCQGEASPPSFLSFSLRSQTVPTYLTHNNTPPIKIFNQWRISSSVSRNEANRLGTIQPSATKKLIEIPVSAGYDRSHILISSSSHLTSRVSTYYAFIVSCLCVCVCCKFENLVPVLLRRIYLPASKNR